MVSKLVVNSMLVLRIVTLAASAATVALVVTNKAKFDDETELKFQDVISFRYEVAVAAIAGAYCIVQLPFAIYYAIQQKRLIRNGFLPEFDFYGDKVTSCLLATGIGASFAVLLEFKKFFDDVLDDDEFLAQEEKFFVRGILASALLSVAFLTMAVVSLISSNIRSKLS